MAIIDHRDVQAVLGVELSALEVERVNRVLIPWATAEVVSILNRTIETTAIVGEQHRTYMWTPTTCVMSLQHTPVLSIEEVRYVSTSSTDVVPSTSYALAPHGVNFGYGPITVVSPWIDTYIEVDYTAGLVGIADHMRGMVEQTMANAVARVLTTSRGNAYADVEGALGVQSLSVEGYSVSFMGHGAEPGGQFAATIAATIGMFEPSEVQALQRLRRRVIR